MSHRRSSAFPLPALAPECSRIDAPLLLFRALFLAAGSGLKRVCRLLPCLALLLLLLLLCPPRLSASEPAPWRPLLTGYSNTPVYLVAVDKSRQMLAFFEKHSPLRLKRVFACTTGQAPGDKLTEGDLKTPEGIYFVVQRIGGGLDFWKYGYEAYTLNYPNPVDRLRKKTGYGIWIHGRGEPLAPLQTEGCVAMYNDDLSLLGKLLRPGTAVALTETFAFDPVEDSAMSGKARHLEKQVVAWSEAWAARSVRYFDFYDQPAYSLAQGESFAAFRAQKERLFKNLPWIRSTVRDIRALQGPGYWVTWFHQDYEAPNLSTSGVRRLYWAENARGEFKILGMEWLPGLPSFDATHPAVEELALQPAHGPVIDSWPPPEHIGFASFAPPDAAGRAKDADTAPDLADGSFTAAAPAASVSVAAAAPVAPVSVAAAAPVASVSVAAAAPAASVSASPVSAAAAVTQPASSASPTTATTPAIPAAASTTVAAATAPTPPPMTGAILGATASPGSFSLPSVFADAGGLSSSGAGGLSSSGAGGLPSSGAGGLPSSGAGGPPSSGAGGLPLSGAALAAVAAGEQAIIDPRLPRDHVENASHGTPARPSPEALALARSLRREHPPATTPEASLTPASTPAAATETASILLAANDFSDGKAPLPESTGSSPAAADTAAAAATATAASDAASDATAAAAADAATAKAASDAATAKAASAHAAVATATTPATTNATAPDAASAATRSPASPATPALRPALAAPAKDSPADAAARDAGSTTPGLTPDAPSADTLVAGSDRQNADNDFSASFPKAAIADRVEAWRRAWQSGLLDAYMGFYAPDAVQGRRKGATEIRRQKRRVWTDAAPADVALDDIRIRVKKDIVIAEMRQRYADKNGNGDVGLKRLTFKQSNGVWLITQEDWSPLPHEIGN